MRKLASLVFLVATLAATDAASAGVGENSILVTGAIARVGALSLRADYLGTSNLAFVQDNTPTAEHLYRVSFFLYLDTAGDFGPAFVMAPGSHHFVLRGRAPLLPTDVWSVLMQRAPSGRYFLNLFAREEAGPRKVGRVFLHTDLWQRITVEWRAATAAGAGDGLARIIKNMSAPGAMDLDNPYRLDKIELGILNGVDPGTTGSYYLDDFQSFRTLAP